MNKENIQICIKDGEVIALQGLDTVTADRLEDILNYVAEVLGIKPYELLITPTK